MKNTWKWIIGVLAALLVLSALFFAFSPYFGVHGMMTWRSHPMMGGFKYFPLGGFWMGFGMSFMWLIPLGLLILAAYGLVSLVNKPNPPAPSRNCPNCGKPAQADWKNCPYCGTGL